MSRVGGTSVSTFVPVDEREEFLLAFAELVYERGYELVRLTDVAERRGVPLAAVEAYWASEEACVIDALQTGTEQTFAAVARAFMSSPGDCAAAAHRSLEVLLRVLAASPALASLSILVPPMLSPRAASRHTGVLDVFAEFLGPGFAAMGHAPPQPEIVSQIVTGGIFEVLRRHAVERRLHELPAALPAVSHVCVAAFFGLDEARRVGTAFDAAA
ncbi:MAG: TetR/AcrR family transcriptional regulator [Patulibacter sp.]|nr:TetR/AcrR family transcriptional regulator [Patulibacter sp.]